MKLNCCVGNTQQKSTQKLNIKAIIKQWNLRPADFRSGLSEDKIPYVTLGGKMLSKRIVTTLYEMLKYWVHFPWSYLKY